MYRELLQQNFIHKNHTLILFHYYYYDYRYYIYFVQKILLFFFAKIHKMHIYCLCGYACHVHFCSRITRQLHWIVWCLNTNNVVLCGWLAIFNLIFILNPIITKKIYRYLSIIECYWVNLKYFKSF